MFDGLNYAMGMVGIILFISVPLGIWKLIDIIIWIIQHVHVVAK